MPQGISPSMLPKPESTGAKALTKTCTQCHGLPSPGLHTAEEWPAVVSRMKMHMKWSKKWMSIDVPNEKELSVLLSYLQNNAQVPIDKTAYSGLESASGKAFSQTCVQCHVLPDPKQHTVDEWPTVVDRMFDHMIALNKVQPDEKETKMILEFLKENASDS
jgi:cytochrome c5